VPFGDRKSDYSVMPGDTVGYFQYAVVNSGTQWLAWWPQSLSSSNWAHPSLYGPMIFSPDVAVAEERQAPIRSLVFRVANPVRERALISYFVAARTDVSLQVYDAAGKLVRTLVSGTQEPGVRNLTWDRTDGSGRRVAQGTYFVRLAAGGSSTATKAVLLD
jgi:hypothetical protein